VPFQQIFRAIITVVLPGLIGISVIACSESQTLPEAGPRATWVWTYSLMNTAQENELLEFSSTNKIDTLYIEATQALFDTPEQLEDFIHLAATRKISVELLMGDHAWIEQDPDTAVRLAEKAAGFIAQMKEPKARAIHFDIEPHALPGWDDGQQYFSNLYLDLLERLRVAVGKTPMNVDLGHFYAGVNVTRSGTTKSLLRWVLDRVDGGVLMAYNSNPNSVLNFVRDEFAQSQGTEKLRIAVACDCSENPLENYCSRETLDYALALAQDRYGSHPNFAGLAVHHYGPYRSLK
jgi:hypothetical protein